MKKTPCGITTQIIEVLTWKTSQSVHFRKLLSMDSYKVKFEIRRDAHDPQSYAVAYVFDKNSMDWKNIYSIPFAEMKTKTGLMYGSHNLTAADFSADSEKLMAGTRSILF